MNSKTIYLSFFLLIIASILSTQFTLVDDWRATHWLMSYDLEFIKRGAAGSVFNIFVNTPISIWNITIAAYSIYFLLSICLALYVVPVFKNDILLITLLLSSGFAVQQLGYDIGRFDQIALLSTLLTLKLSPLSKNYPFIITFLLIFLSAISMLIHEASALLAVPLTFSALSISTIKNKASYVYPSIYLISSICIFASIVLVGSPVTSAENWIDTLQNKADFEINLNSAAVTHNSLKDNILISLERLTTLKTLNRMLLVILFSTIYIYAIYRIFQKQLASESRAVSFLALLPIAATIPLYFLGLDYYRWIALAMLNTLLILSYLRHVTEAPSIQLSKRALFLLVMFTLYTGPLGISTALPERLLFFHSINSLF